MGDRWGDQGPPQEAYSRVTRDLRAVTAGFADYLTDLPAELVAAYECTVRELTTQELELLRGTSSGPFDEAYAVQPSDPSGTTLLIARKRFEEGASVTLGLGIAINPGIPSCFCDACDENSESLIEQASRYVSIAVDGFTEFRRPHPFGFRGWLLGGQRWMEHGFRWSGGAETGGGADVRGEPFTKDWGPLPRRIATG
jgi:hypothetical protein